MSRNNTAVAAETENELGEPKVDLRPINLALLDPMDSQLIPANKLISDYFADGYELSGYRNRSRDAAKEEASRIRKEEGKRTAYITLLAGWFGVLVADPKPESAKAKAEKPARAVVPCAVQSPTGETMQFDSTKSARAFARIILEAARQAEFEADLAEAQAARQS